MAPGKERSSRRFRNVDKCEGKAGKGEEAGIIKTFRGPSKQAQE